MGVDSVYCGPKKKWVPGKNKWESTLFNVGQKKWVPEKNKWESTLYTVGKKMGAREK